MKTYKCYIDIDGFDKTTNGKRKVWKTDAILTNCCEQEKSYLVWEKDTKHNNYYGYQGYVRLSKVILLNDYSYSVTTARHQRLVRSFLEQHDINSEDMLFIETTKSLSEGAVAIQDAIQDLYSKSMDLAKLIEAKGSRKATNAERELEIKRIYNEIEVLQKLLKSITE